MLKRLARPIDIVALLQPLAVLPYLNHDGAERRGLRIDGRLRVLRLGR